MNPTFFTTRMITIIVITITLIFLNFYISKSVLAQLNGCPPQEIETKGWQRSPSGTTVYYYIEPSFASAQKTQIRLAFQRWTQASSSLCLKINFVEGISPESSEITVNNSTIMPTTTGLGIDPGTKILLYADININPNEFSPTARGYDTVFLKGTLHEVGHTMGLDHPGINFVGNSVMNARSGVNDSDNYVPTDV